MGFPVPKISRSCHKKKCSQEYQIREIMMCMFNIMDSMGSKIPTVYSGCYYSLRKKSMVVFEKCLALFEVLQSTP